MYRSVANTYQIYKAVANGAKDTDLLQVLSIIQIFGKECQISKSVTNGAEHTDLRQVLSN